MRQITVAYHREGNGWWAEATAVDGFSAAADTLEELRQLTREGIEFALDGEPHLIFEVDPGVALGTSTSGVAAGIREISRGFIFPTSRAPERALRTNAARLAIA